MDLVKPLEVLSRAKGFKANMIASIIIIGMGYQMVSELIAQDWIKNNPDLQKLAVGAVIGLLACIVVVTIRWLRTFRETRLKHVFVAFPSMESEPFHVEVLRGITEKLASEYTVTLWLPQHGGKYTGSAFEGFLRKVKEDSALYMGGIVLPTEIDHKNPQVLSKLIQEIGLPVVIIDTLPRAFLNNGLLKPGQQFIGFNNVQGGCLAARAMSEEFKSMGISPQRILILHAKEQLDRHESFISEMMRLYSGIEFDLDECSWNRQRARRKTLNRIERSLLEKYQGIFGCNDEMAIGAIEAIAGSALSTEDLVIIGYDGSPSAKVLLRVGNTSLRNFVVQDGYKLGVEAAERLIHSGQDVSLAEPSKPVYLDTELEKPYW